MMLLCRYIETINLLLRPGGIWINQGPLLYHWVSDAEGNRDERYDQSIEVTSPSASASASAFEFVFILVW